MLALRSCAYSMYTCIYAVANITIDPTFYSKGAPFFRGDGGTVVDMWYPVVFSMQQLRVLTAKRSKCWITVP